MSELAKRILVAVPAASLFLYLTWLGGWYFTTLMILIGLQVVRESLGLFRHAGLSPHPYMGYLFGLFAMTIPLTSHPFQLGLALLLLFMLLQLPKPSEENIRTLGSTLFAGLYGPLGLMAFILIRSLAGAEGGFILAVTLLLMVWGNDIFAYFGGRALGKHKLAPDISPNKTWEGFFAGILGATAGFLGAFYLLPAPHPLTLVQGLVPVVLISIFGPAGDLAASKLKRACKVKDTSNLLPGHGGFFDRFDALILAAPAFYLYLYVLELFGYASF